MVDPFDNIVEGFPNEKNSVWFLNTMNKSEYRKYVRHQLPFHIAKSKRFRVEIQRRQD